MTSMDSISGNTKRICIASDVASLQYLWLPHTCYATLVGIFDHPVVTWSMHSTTNECGSYLLPSLKDVAS